MAKKLNRLLFLFSAFSASGTLSEKNASIYTASDELSASSATPMPNTYYFTNVLPCLITCDNYFDEKEKSICTGSNSTPATVYPFVYTNHSQTAYEYYGPGIAPGTTGYTIASNYTPNTTPDIPAIFLTTTLPPNPPQKAMELLCMSKNCRGYNNSFLFWEKTTTHIGDRKNTMGPSLSAANENPCASNKPIPFDKHERSKRPRP